LLNDIFHRLLIKLFQSSTRNEGSIGFFYLTEKHIAIRYRHCWEGEAAFDFDHCAASSSWGISFSEQFLLQMSEVLTNFAARRKGTFCSPG